MNLLRRARRVLVLPAGSLNSNMQVVEAAVQLVTTLLGALQHDLPMYKDDLRVCCPIASGSGAL